MFPAPVIVTFLKAVQEPPREQAQTRSVTDILHQLAETAGRGTFADIDPVQWQREQRTDRILPGRENE
jgi:hypothetical protein